MEPDDKDFINITVANIADDYSTAEPFDISKYITNIDVSGDDTFDFILDTHTRYDNSYGVVPVPENPTVYTSYEQRELHEKYPALQKAWEDYLNMYNLTQGEPPIVD